MISSRQRDANENAEDFLLTQTHSIQVRTENGEENKTKQLGQETRERERLMMTKTDRHIHTFIVYIFIYFVHVK